MSPWKRVTRSFRNNEESDPRITKLLDAAADGDYGSVEHLLDEYSFDVVDHPKLVTRLVELMFTSMPYLKWATRSRLPIHAALIMCKAFKHVAKQHSEARTVLNDYAQLCEYLSIELLYELLDSFDGDIDRLRNEVFEIKVQLDWSNGMTKWQTAIDIAIQLQSAMFISCPLTQLYLDALWNGPHRVAEEGENRYQSLWKDLSLFIISPRARYWVFNVMYLTFVALTTEVLVTRQYPMQAFTWTEVAMYIFVVGLIMHEVQQALEEDSSAYLTSLWNWFDLILYAGFITAFVLRILDFTAPDHTLDASCDCHFYSNLSFDVISCVVVIIWLRVLQMFTSFQGLGVLMVSLRNMMSECVKFLVFLAAVFWGFMSAFYALYGSPIGSRDAASYLDIFWLLLQALFGQWYVDLSQWTTQRYLSQFMFVIYLLICVIILMNLLIGVFSAAIARVQGHSEAEYKFDQCLTIMEFKNDQGIPPPFNLIAMFGVIFGDIPLWTAEVLTLLYVAMVFIPIGLVLLLGYMLYYGLRWIGHGACVIGEKCGAMTSGHQHIVMALKAGGENTALNYGGQAPVIVRPDPLGWQNGLARAMLQQNLLNDMLQQFSSERHHDLSQSAQENMLGVGLPPSPSRASARRASPHPRAAKTQLLDKDLSDLHRKSGDRMHNLHPVRSSMQGGPKSMKRAGVSQEISIRPVVEPTFPCLTVTSPVDTTLADTHPPPSISSLQLQG